MATSKAGGASASKASSGKGSPSKGSPSKTGAKAKAGAKADAKTPPWDKGNPKETSGASTHHLTTSEKAAAKRSAAKAGRPYPNLVDNMRVAAKAEGKGTK